LTFKSKIDPQFIKFGSARDRDLKLDIFLGNLSYLGKLYLCHGGYLPEAFT